MITQFIVVGVIVDNFNVGVTIANNRLVMTKVCSDTLLTIGFCCSSALLLSSRCQPWYLSTVAAQQRPPLGHFHCTDRQPCTLDISEANISCCHLSVPSLVPSLANPSLPTYLSLLVSPSFPLSFGSLVPWFIGFSLSLSLSFSHTHL